jgi:hypothetical protein
MRRFVPFIVLALGACDAPFEELYPAETFTFGEGSETIDVRAQYDPLERAWFTRSSSRFGKLTVKQRFEIFDLVEQKVGPKLCEGKPLKVEPEKIWSGHGATTIRYLPEIGAWQLVGECAD